MPAPETSKLNAYSRDLKSLLLQPTIVVTFLTALSYINALTFQIGYLHYYGINFVFASVSTEAFILYGLTLLVLTFLIFSNKSTILDMWYFRPVNPKPILNVLWGELRPVSLIFVYFLPLMVYYDFLFKGFLAALGLLVVLILLELLRLWLDSKKSDELLEAVRLKKEKEKKKYSRDKPVLIIIMILFFSLTISAVLGESFASSRTSYAVTDDGFLIISHHSNEFILAGYDKRNNHINGKYKISESEQATNFRVIEIKNLTN
jgi:hypothetical protein